MTYIRSTHDLEDQIVELAGHLNAGNYRFLFLISEFDRHKGRNCRATKDCAHWINWKCGINPGAAREKVRTARAPCRRSQQPWSEARSNCSKVLAITRVAISENEHREVSTEIANCGTETRTACIS